MFRFRLAAVHWWVIALLAASGGGIVETRTAVAADQAAVQAAIQKAMGYVRLRMAGRGSDGLTSLMALSLVKAKEPADSPHIRVVVDKVRQKVVDGAYRPTSNHFYEASVDINLLVDVDPEALRPEIEAITRYILAGQLPEGGWDYPQRRPGNGDTSVTQYACLGLWAAARAGVEIEGDVWNRIIAWHARFQSQDGGFAYVPGHTEGEGRGASTLSLTGGAVSSIFIAARELVPEQADRILEGTVSVRTEVAAAPADTRRFGVLEKVDIAEPVAAGSPKGLTVPASQMQGSARRAVQYFTAKYSSNGDPPNYWMIGYYYYTLERMGALANLKTIGAHDWYDEVATILITQQQADGSWDFAAKGIRGETHRDHNTPFCLLFLTKSTAKLIRPAETPEPGFGAGLLSGGRGLPEDLATAQLKDGKIEGRKSMGAVDDLLAALQNVDNVEVADVQEQLIGQVQLGDRESLIGKKDQLVKLVSHPSAEVRRTVIWALGRTNDFSLARYAITALEDGDVDVMVEAHNALCWLARDPNAFGLPPTPYADLPETAAAEQKAAAVITWRKEAVRRWGAWYLDKRPFDDRGDEFEAQLREKLGI